MPKYGNKFLTFIVNNKHLQLFDVHEIKRVIDTHTISLDYDVSKVRTTLK